MIRIEPDGMDFEIPIAGVSYQVQPQLPPPQPAGHSHLGKTSKGAATSSGHHASLTKSNREPVNWVMDTLLYTVHQRVCLLYSVRVGMDLLLN